MPINIKNSLNSYYPQEQTPKLSEKLQPKIIKRSQSQNTESDKSNTIKLTDEAKALQVLHEEIAKMPKSDDEKVQKIREKFLNGELGVMQEGSKAIEAYNSIADKILSIDEMF